MIALLLANHMCMISYKNLLRVALPHFDLFAKLQKSIVLIIGLIKQLKQLQKEQLMLKIKQQSKRGLNRIQRDGSQDHG